MSNKLLTAAPTSSGEAKQSSPPDLHPKAKRRRSKISNHCRRPRYDATHDEEIETDGDTTRMLYPRLEKLSSFGPRHDAHSGFQSAPTGLEPRADWLQGLELDASLRTIIDLPRRDILRPNASREEIRLIIHGIVSNTLADPQSVNHDWMAELCEFEHGEEPIDFVTKIVTAHIFERPWVLCDNFLSLLTKDSQSFLSHSRPCRSAYQEFLSAPQSTTHKEFHESGEPGLSERRWIAEAPPPPVFPDHTERYKPYVPLPDTLDALLGCAGFIPLSGSPTSHMSEHVGGLIDKDAVLDELQAHVQFLGIIEVSRPVTAKVSFTKYGSQNQPDLRILVSRISNTIERLEVALQIYQGLPVNTGNLLFLKHTRSVEGDLVVTVESLNLELVHNLFGVFKDQKENLLSLLDEANMPETWDPIPNYARAGAFLGLRAGAVFTPIGAACLAIYPSIALRYSLRTEFGRRVLQAQKTYLVAMSPILALLFPDGTHYARDGGKNSTLLATLHLMSLVVQFISLTIQSGIRHFIAPIDFSFLEDSVGNFVLEGALPGEDLKIFATSQSLSCLGSMLGSPVLVFSHEPKADDEALDLVTSLAEVLSIWGPGKIVYREVRRRSASYSGQRDIDFLDIGGGIVSRSDSHWRWHWEAAGNSKDHGDTPGEGERIEIDLHTKVRIGTSAANLSTAPPTGPSSGKMAPSAKSHVDVDTTLSQLHNPPTAELPSPGPLRSGTVANYVSIGPATLNSACLHAASNADGSRWDDLNNLGLLKPIGTFDDYFETIAREGGLAAGQYVTVDFKNVWEKRRGFSFKDYLLSPDVSFETLNRELNTNCGVFISICPAVMARTRLRDILALVIDATYDSDKQVLSVCPSRVVVGSLANALRGAEPLEQWIQSVSTGPVDEVRKELRDILFKSLKMLQHTGVTRARTFEAAWFSKGRPLRALWTTCVGGSWLSMLADSILNASFVVVTDKCWRTPQRLCSTLATKWSLQNFVLSTRMCKATANPTFGTHVLDNSDLQVNTRYILDGAMNGLDVKAVKVLDVDDGRHVTYLEVSRSRLGHQFRKRIRECPSLRECDTPWAKDCVVSNSTTV